MGLTPVEIVFYGLLAASAALLALLILWHFTSTGRQQLRQWQASRQRRPDAFLALQTANTRLQAEHAMMARKLELVMDKARELATTKEAEASRAINRAGMLEEELATARKQIREYEQTIVEMGRQLTDLRREITDTHHKAERIYEWRSELEQRLQERKRELEKLRHELFLRADRLAKTKRKLQTTSMRLKEAEEQNERLLKERTHLSGQNESLRKELDSNADIIRRLEQTLNEERARFLREKMELQDKVTDLAAKLAEKEAELLAARAGAQAGAEAAGESGKQRASA